MSEYVKGYILKDVSQKYMFELTEIYEGDSFLLHCSFYQTKYKDIYITDYDFRNRYDLEKKGLSMLFCRKNSRMNTQMISNELFKDEELFNEVLDTFKKEIT